MDEGAGGRDSGSGPDDDRALHARLLQRDPLAPSDLAVGYLEPLCAWLDRQNEFRDIDRDVLRTVTIDLILSVAERPEQYDPERLGLEAYLRMAVRGDVRNARASERRRIERLVPLGDPEDVELSRAARNSLVEGPADPADVVAEAEAVDANTIAAIRGHFDDAEWEVVQLMMESERRTSVFAPILGLSDRPRAEQEREVKRTKDRLWKRLQRLRTKVRRDD